MGDRLELGCNSRERSRRVKTVESSFENLEKGREVVQSCDRGIRGDPMDERGFNALF
jgi:hypothetical protein